MKQAIRPAIFKWRQTEPELILCAVRWYLRYSLSFRDVEELLRERGLEADHTTIWHWVQHYGPELHERLRRHLKPTNSPGVSMRLTFVSRAVGSTSTEPSIPPAPRSTSWDVLQLSKSSKRAIGRVGRAPSHAATSNTLLMN